MEMVVPCKGTLLISKLPPMRLVLFFMFLSPAPLLVIVLPLTSSTLKPLPLSIIRLGSWHTAPWFVAQETISQ